MKYIILAYIIVIPLTFLRGAETRSAQELFFQIFSMIIFAAGMFFPSRKIKVNGLNVCLGLMLLAFIISWIRTMNGWQAIGMNYLCGLLVYFTIIRTLEKKDVKFLLKGITWMCILAAIWLTLQLFGYELRDMRNVGNISRISTNAFFWQNSAKGIYFGQGLPLIACITPLAFLFFLPVIQAECSGAIIGAMAGYLFFLWFRKRIFFWILLPVILAVGIYYNTTREAYVGLQIRIPMWGMIIQDIVRNPFGYGLNSFEQPSSNQWRYYRHPSSNRYMRVVNKDGKVHFQEPVKEFVEELIVGNSALQWQSNPHNEYLWLGYEVGLWALGILGFMYYFIWQRFWRSTKDVITCALMGSLIAMAIIMIPQFLLHLSRVGHLLPVIGACFFLQTEEDS